MKLQLLFLLYSFIYRDHFAEGKRLYELNRFEEGLASFDMAIKHNPTDLNAFTGRGLCLHHLNRLEEALAVNDMALKHNPNHSLAINNPKRSFRKIKIKINKNICFLFLFF